MSRDWKRSPTVEEGSDSPSCQNGRASKTGTPIYESVAQKNRWLHEGSCTASSLPSTPGDRAPSGQDGAKLPGWAKLQHQRKD